MDNVKYEIGLATIFLSAEGFYVTLYNRAIIVNRWRKKGQRM